MHLWLLAVGRLRPGPMRDLYEDYAGRLGPAGGITLREVEPHRKAAASAELKRLEAEALREAIPSGATLVALDERGASLSSAAFSAKIGDWRDRGVSDLAFIIGGADGLDEPLRASASLVMGLGSLTWPHMLVRVMIAEQLYRAHCILSGHPYHRA